MNLPDDDPAYALQLFEPDPNAIYSLEVTAHLAQVPRRAILVYYKHGLVSSVVDPALGGYCFNDEAIRTLRRIEDLRAAWGDNLACVKLILDLMSEVERLRAEVRFLRG